MYYIKFSHFVFEIKHKDHKLKSIKEIKKALPNTEIITDGNIIQDSNVKIDNNRKKEYKMLKRKEEEKEEEYINNELRKANKFKHGKISIFLDNKFELICCFIAVMSLIQMIIFRDNTIKSFIFFLLLVSSLMALGCKD